MNFEGKKIINNIYLSSIYLTLYFIIVRKTLSIFQNRKDVIWKRTHLNMKGEILKLSTKLFLFVLPVVIIYYLYTKTNCQPHTVTFVKIENVEDAWNAIKTMKVRGAPAIAIEAALGISTEYWNKSMNSKQI